MRRGLLVLLVLPALLAGSARAGMYFPPPADQLPVWSPDASAIAYFHQGEGLHVVNPDGSSNRLLAGIPNSPYFAFSPTWHWLAILVFQNVPNAFSLELMRPDGTERATLATDARGVEPAFSPDGTRIAYAANDGLRVISLAGVNVRFSPDDARDLAWSPDGSRLAYDTNGHIAVADGSGVLAGPAGSSGPAWSQSGTLAYFVRPKAPRLVVGAASFGINTWSGTHPSWSADGRAVFYVSGNDLYRVDVLTGKSARVGPGGADLAIGPGDRFAFAAVGDCGDRVGLYVGTQRITSDCHVYGTSGPDVLTASSGLYERVEGLGGNDVLTALGAPYVGDELDGGTGDDVLSGSEWRDKLDGGPGNDAIDGGPSGDTIIGGPGHDRLYGQGGRDTIYARDGARDVVDCGTTLDGSPEHDVAYVDKIDVVRNCEVVFRK